MDVKLMMMMMMMKSFRCIVALLLKSYVLRLQINVHITVILKGPPAEL